MSSNQIIVLVCAIYFLTMVATGIFAARRNKKASDFLVANLGFFFVPPGVALMLYFDVIAAEFWPIVIATIVSTALVLVVTGWVHQIVRKFRLARQIKLARKLHLPDLHLSDRLRLKDKINLMNKDK